MRVKLGQSPYGLILAAGLVMILAVLFGGATAWAYPANRDGAQQFAAAFCSSNPQGMADYVWLSAPGSENDTNITVVYPNTTTTVRVNLYSQHCGAYPSGYASGSSYWSDIGGISGSFGYGNNYPWGVWDDSQLKPLNVDGWGPGSYTICMTLETWTDAPGFSPKPSPSACSTLRLTVIYPWDTQGSSLVGVGPNQAPNVGYWGSTKPGDTVRWRHRITNVTPYTSDRINFQVNRSGFSGGALPSGNVVLAGRETAYMGYQPTFARWGESPYIVTQNDVGKELCEWIHWSPGNYEGAVGDNRKGACVFVPYDFKLTPSVSPVASAAEPGTTIGPITSSVSNAGPTKSYDNVRWELSRFVVNPGGTAPSKAENRTVPCTYFGGGCKTAASGTNTFMPGDTPAGQLPTDTVDDLPLGAQFCYALSLSGYETAHAPGDGWWSHSAPRCVKVGKKPKVQIQGHDVAVRGTIDTSTTTKSGTTFGSWVEYGAFSTGANSQFASGSGLMNPAKHASSAQSAWSDLTFANSAVPVSCGTQFGCYTPSANFRPLPGIAAYFGAMQKKAYDTSASLDANAGETGSVITVRTADDLTLKADQLSKGKTLIVVASGTVTVSGDLTYAKTPLTSVYDIPQLVIIAKNINIQSGVRTVDAWLVTSDTTGGIVNTCSDVTPPLTGKVCDQPLTVHGPIVAGKLLLYRTAGSGTGAASGDPAELIDLRPDAYLWARLVAGGTGKAETVSTVELPPRF